MNTSRRRSDYTSLVLWALLPARGSGSRPVGTEWKIPPLFIRICTPAHPYVRVRSHDGRLSAHRSPELTKEAINQRHYSKTTEGAWI
ncbi:hypothetical protein BC827DRAFT_805835 [Russula dissimulans]|nr:hypothetical protein BC827DRAFT_805835 [Russula dissimulans]